MSIQFGKWSLDNKPVDNSYLDRVKSAISVYVPSGCTSCVNGNIGILYSAVHTTKESRRERQPHTLPSGAVITWDGRLDNGAELTRDLGSILAADSTDLEIVAAAYERWGTECLARLLGDWALAIWNGTTQSLLLAKDFMGIRQLYYSVDKHQITWSTILDPLVLLAGRQFAVSEEYIAGWFSFFPGEDLTPYVGIHSVPPSSFVLLGPGEHTIKRYWEFDPSKTVSYNTETEYDEHFRAAFGDAVRRRLRSDSPILAHLSGGTDSSSIVCMADHLIGSGGAETQRLDTLSYFNDSEPNWNERPYFSKVEQQRGRTGFHIDVSGQQIFRFELEDNNFEATPVCTAARTADSRESDQGS